MVFNGKTDGNAHTSIAIRDVKHVRTRNDKRG